MSNLNASKGVNTSALATAKRNVAAFGSKINALIPFKNTGRSLTTRIRNLDATKVTLSLGTLVGAGTALAIDPWLLPFGVITGVMCATTIKLAVNYGHVCDSIGERFFCGSMAVLGGIALSLSVLLMSDSLYKTFNKNDDFWPSQHLKTTFNFYNKNGAPSQNPEKTGPSLFITEARTVDIGKDRYCEIKGHLPDDKGQPDKSSFFTQRKKGACTFTNITP